MRIFFILIQFYPSLWMVFLFFGGFTRFDQTALDQFPVFSDVIDISKKGEVKWTPNTEHWKTLIGFTSYKGKAMLSLNFDSPANADAPKTDLQVEMSALGVNKYGKKQDRNIIDWYITSNKPFSKSMNIWAASKEWGLGMVEITGDEDIIITMTILEPNLHPKLHCPRFKLIVAHDYAWTSHVRRIYFTFYDFLFTALAVGISIVFVLKPWEENIEIPN